MEVNIFTKDDAIEINTKLDKVIALIEDWDYEAKSSSLYSNEQLAIKLDVSKKTLQNYRDQGKISFTKIGRKIFYTQQNVVDFLNNNSLKSF